MATINFNLDKPDSKGKYHIILIFRKEGKRFKVSTHHKVESKYWNSKKQRVKSTGEAVFINGNLNKLEEKINSIIQDLNFEKTDYDIEDVKSRFHGNLIGKKKIDLFEYFVIFIEQKNASKKRKTLNEYITIVNDLKEYEIYYNEKLSFEKINDEFLSKYLKFLFEEKGNVTNTVAKKISTLKTMLRAATRTKLNPSSNLKINTNLDFLDFKVKKIETKKITLTDKELISLLEHDLNQHPRLERVRDKFCFACFACLTGMRFGDLKELKEEWIFEDERVSENYFLKYKDEKTKTDISIPLSPLALKLISKNRKLKTDKKNDNYIFQSISSQRYNQYLKELGKEVGIDQSISIKKYIGNKVEEIIFKKYELFSSHVARRTFISLSMMQGAEPVAVQKTVGHKSIKTTMGYTTIEDDWRTEQMRNAWDNFGK